MPKKNNIILASSSVSRRKIMDATGIKYISLKPLVNEENLKKNFKGTTKKLALMLAEEKALSVSSKHNDCYVIGADQVLSFKGEVYNKPKTMKEAEETFACLETKLII